MGPALPSDDEAADFWAAAEAAVARETHAERIERMRLEAEVDLWMDRLR